MDIAAMSIVNSMSRVQEAFSIGLLDKVMEQSEQQSASMMQMLEATKAPVAPGGIGYLLDVRA